MAINLRRRSYVFSTPQMTLSLSKRHVLEGKCPFWTQNKQKHKWFRFHACVRIARIGVWIRRGSICISGAPQIPAEIPPLPFLSPLLSRDPLSFPSIPSPSFSLPFRLLYLFSLAPPTLRFRFSSLSPSSSSPIPFLKTHSSSMPLGTLGLHFISLFSDNCFCSYFTSVYINKFWPNYFRNSLDLYLLPHLLLHITYVIIASENSGPKGIFLCNDPLGGRFAYFLFLSVRGRGRGSPRRREGGGGFFFMENPRRGGGLLGGGGRRGAGRVFAGSWGGG